MLFAKLNDKKRGYEEKTAFQTIVIELYKQLTKQIKQNIRLVVSSTRIGVVAKINDNIYVLRTTKTYSYFLFVFSNVS